MSKTGGARPAARHPIRVVAERTGLSPEVIRAWERRYAVVEPERTESGQRVYTDADVERLRLLRVVTSAGRAISAVAQLETEALRALAQEDRRQRQPERVPGASPAEAEAAGRVVERVQEAVLDLHGAGVEAELRRALFLLGADRFLDGVAVPLLRWLGEGWAAGELGIAHEHLASAVLRRVLGRMADAAADTAGAPSLVCATPQGQVHEFGALLVAAVAAARGWRTTYLGADLPAEEIARAAMGVGARAVALSIVVPEEEALAQELWRLRRALPPGVRVLVGGAGVGRQAALLESVGASVLEGLPELRATLAELETEE